MRPGMWRSYTSSFHHLGGRIDIPDMFSGIKKTFDECTQTFINTKN